MDIIYVEPDKTYITISIISQNLGPMGIYERRAFEVIVTSNDKYTGTWNWTVEGISSEVAYFVAGNKFVIDGGQKEPLPIGRTIKISVM